MSELLTPQDPSPYCVWPAEHSSPFVFVSDHAGRLTPEKLGEMGLPKEAWQRHIAYDIGIGEVGRHIREAFGSSLIEQVYSRLVIDCNRSAGHKTSIPTSSDAMVIPDNQSLTEHDKRARENAILHPYHREIARILDKRDNVETLFVSLHSFTPYMQGEEAHMRPWHVGFLHHHDPKTARLMRQLCLEEGGLCVGDNEPYVLNPTNEYTTPHHAQSRQLPALEIEIRQDLISDEIGQKEWAERFIRLLPKLWDLRKGQSL